MPISRSIGKARRFHESVDWLSIHSRSVRDDSLTCGCQSILLPRTCSASRHISTRWSWTPTPNNPRFGRRGLRVLMPGPVSLAGSPRLPYRLLQSYSVLRSRPSLPNSYPTAASPHVALFASTGGYHASPRQVGFPFLPKAISGCCWLRTRCSHEMHRSGLLSKPPMGTSNPLRAVGRPHYHVLHAAILFPRDHVCASAGRHYRREPASHSGTLR